MILDKIIFYCFATLFFLVPLIFSPLNFELFEFNKMLLTYFLTITIVGCWLLKTINYKQLTIHRTPLDIPLLLFLGVNILSAIFSIDTHTSIFGYYSRLNGGLLSLVSYLLLYFAFVSNVPKEKILTLLKITLFSGIIVALWGILEHFGVSLSCTLLKSDWKNLDLVFNADCWVQDVQARVFATLGQPNWMAGYLAMLIFPALYFFLISKTRASLYTFFLLLSTLYLAFTFTYSRGATLGLIGGFLIFLVFLLKDKTNFKKISLIILTFLFINFLFGSALTSFKLIQKFAPPPRPAISTPIAQSGTQLETGGTESGQIRLIVWQGALDIFKAYPLLGSGLETFAYSYYQYRPISHNLTSEWDFLYNKAHNEYLNYLSTTGLVGFLSYLTLIITFLVYSIRYIVYREHKGKTLYTSYTILYTAILASYLSYLIYISTLFSTVSTAIFFFLFPAFAFVITDNVKPLKISLVYLRPVYVKGLQIFVLLFIFYLLFSIFKYWYADSRFAKGMSFSENDNPGRAYNLLSTAVSINPNEPLYQSELGYAGAASALALQDIDATLSAELKEEAIFITEKVLKENPNNTSFWRTAIRTYFEIAGLDNSFTQKTIDSLDQTIKLAPTDPKLYYNKAVILEAIGQKEQAKLALKKAIELKPNYQEAREQLDEINK